MEDKFVWTAEIKFEGTVDEFNQLTESLEELPVEIYIPEWLRRPHHFAGCMPVPFEVLLGAERLQQLAEDMPRIQIKYISNPLASLNFVAIL